MNKKGFTLVELISVIVVLGIILVLAVPAILRARDNALKGINKEERRNIEEAGKMLAIDLDDFVSDVYNCKVSWINCELDDSNTKWMKATVRIEDLTTHDYFEDKNKHCNGNIIVSRIGDNNYDVDISGIHCTN